MPFPTDLGCGTALGSLPRPWPEETSPLALLTLPMKTLGAFDLHFLTLSILLP